MKVLNIAEESKFGGPQKRIALIAKELMKLEVETVVLTSNFESEDFVENLKKSGIRSKSIKLQKLSPAPSLLLKYIWTFFGDIYRIVKVISSERPDVIHCNGTYQVKSVLASFVSRTPFVWHINDTSFPLIFKLWAFLMGPQASGLIYASEASKDYYKEFLKNSNFKMIPAPVESVKYNEKKIGQDRIILSKTSINVLNIGNLNYIKGTDKFVLIASELNKLFGKNLLKFYCVGAILPRHKKHFDNIIKLKEKLQVDNLEFLGFRNDIPQILSEADFYLNCSISESFKY